VPEVARAGEASVSRERSRALAAWEIVSVVTTGLAAEWAMLANVGLGRAWLLVPFALAFALTITSHRARGESPRDLGFRFDNFARALRLLAPLMIGGALLLALWGWFGLGGRFRLGGGRGAAYWLSFTIWDAPWGLLQQYVLQAFVNRRAQMVFGAGRRSVLLTALVFALLHLPNPWLAAATLAGGLVWAYAYQREPNLFALALSHAAMTWVLIATFPPGALRSLRVGFKYFG
jgi:membrane protease YdiL (CAAX protease family)